MSIANPTLEDVWQLFRESALQKQYPNAKQIGAFKKWNACLKNKRSQPSVK